VSLKLTKTAKTRNTVAGNGSATLKYQIAIGARTSKGGITFVWLDWYLARHGSALGQFVDRVLRRRVGIRTGGVSSR